MKHLQHKYLGKIKIPEYQLERRANLLVIGGQYVVAFEELPKSVCADIIVVLKITQNKSYGLLVRPYTKRYQNKRFLTQLTFWTKHRHENKGNLCWHLHCYTDLGETTSCKINSNRYKQTEIIKGAILQAVKSILRGFSKLCLNLILGVAFQLVQGTEGAETHDANGGNWEERRGWVALFVAA